MKHVLTHGNCPDGFTAEWLIRQDSAWTDAEFHQMQYDTPIPDMTGASDVLIADFCPTAEQVLEIAAVVERVTILDHHKTAVENLAGVKLPSNVDARFDMSRSGAMMVLNHLFPPGDSYRPAFINLVEYVQDRDLWLWEQPESKEISALILATPFDLTAWNHLSWNIRHHFYAAVDTGRLLMAADAKVIASLKALARPVMIDGWHVLAAPSPYTYGSALAGELAEGYPFGAYYIDHADGRQWGLRSRDGGVDVSAVAAKFGGGGHRSAAGFKVPWSHELAAEPIHLTDLVLGVDG